MTCGPFPAYPVLASSAQAVSPPVHGLDAPLAAGDGGEVRCAGLVRVEAGDGVDDFLADEGAGDVEAVAADPRDPGDLREVQVAGTGDPQGPLDDAAVAVVELDVVGGFRARGLDQVEDGALHAGLAALDEQEAVRVPAAVFSPPGNVFRGLPLRVRRVGGDHRAMQVHGLQQFSDLRGLG